MAGTSSNWNKKKGDRGHTIMPIHFEWISHPSNPKNAPLGSYELMIGMDWLATHKSKLEFIIKHWSVKMRKGRKEPYKEFKILSQ
jgi:hypothetical protein